MGKGVRKKPVTGAKQQIPSVQNGDNKITNFAKARKHKKQIKVRRSKQTKALTGTTISNVQKQHASYNRVSDTVQSHNVGNGAVKDDERATHAPSTSAKSAAFSPSTYMKNFQPKRICVSSTQRLPEDLDSPHAQAASGRGLRVLQWLLWPMQPADFWREIFEVKPLLIQRHHMPDYYKGWLSVDELQQLLHRETLQYGLHVDVVKYNGNKRNTFNYNQSHSIKGANGAQQDQEASCTTSNQEQLLRTSKDYALVSPYFSPNTHLTSAVRLLHPQRWSVPCWHLLSSLEQYVQCVTGCNVYLTPGNSQGFAPHYDDIDAFILQVSGSKRWRVYKPVNDDILPVVSSNDFKQNQLPDQCMEVTLQPGDLLYMPRGTPHQAVVDHEQSTEQHPTPSLHLTISMCQAVTWGDVLGAGVDVAMMRATASTCETGVHMRRSVQRGMFYNLGVKHEDENNKAESIATKRVQQLTRLIAQSFPIHDVIDHYAAKFQLSRLPPPFIKHKYNNKQAVKWVTRASSVQACATGCWRVCVEDERAVVYHCLYNKREEHGVDRMEAIRQLDDKQSCAGVLSFDIDLGGAIEEYLQGGVVSVGDVAERVGQDNAVQVARSLYSAGLIKLVL